VLHCWEIREKYALPKAADVDKIITGAMEVLVDTNAVLQNRVEALKLVAFVDFGEKESLLLGYLDTKYPRDLQQEALKQLARTNTPETVDHLIERWSTFSPIIKSRVSDILLYNAGNHDKLLSAIEEKKISLGELNLHLERRRKLLFSKNENVRKRAEVFFNDAGVVTRKEAMTRYTAALSMQGDIGKGRLVFNNLCAQCHVKGKTGIEVGPNLTEIARKSGQTLLHDILDPNAAVDTEYINHFVTLETGEKIGGIITGETDKTITLKNIGGDEHVVSRKNIKLLESSGKSLMPEGLEASIDASQMADLLEFLQSTE